MIQGSMLQKRCLTAPEMKSMTEISASSSLSKLIFVKVLTDAHLRISTTSPLRSAPVTFFQMKWAVEDNKLVEHTH